MIVAASPTLLVGSWFGQWWGASVGTIGRGQRRRPGCTWRRRCRRRL